MLIVRGGGRIVFLRCYGCLLDGEKEREYDKNIIWHICMTFLKNKNVSNIPKILSEKEGGRGKTCKIKWAWWYTSDISATLILE